MFNFKRFEFRPINKDEAAEAARIEAICFPPNEACTKDMMIKRAERAPETFVVAFDKVNHKLAGFINGLATNEDKFRDEFFSNVELHDKNGKNIMILGLDVLPEYRHNGLAGAMMDYYIDLAENCNREKLILTCHDHLVEFYEGFGYEDIGYGDSVWGGSHWHDMVFSTSKCNEIL